jgi:hypothetical protein
VNEMSMFGCRASDLDQMTSRFEYPDEWTMFAMSILSDSQEELARGNVETARQFINRAKHVINRHHQQLRSLYEAQKKRETMSEEARL